jgi:hypothetical protein
MTETCCYVKIYSFIDQNKGVNMSQGRNQKFDDERIKKVERLIKNKLNKPPYINNYTEEEIAEANRRIKLAPKKPEVSTLNFFTSHNQLNRQRTPLIAHANLDDECLSCLPCNLF